MPEKYIKRLHEAIHNGDAAAIVLVCREIEAQRSYPRSLIDFARATRLAYYKAGINKPGSSADTDSNGHADTQLAYGSFYERREPRLLSSAEVRAYAFYLPQYHIVPENNKWWGTGFTEWTNTKRCRRAFSAHYQPRIPHKDIGYYDLSEKNAIHKQARLAKSSGIEGFCFYYYWFSGRCLLETPLLTLSKDRDLDIGFMICWANENWTRVWDGLNHQVLVKQHYFEGWEEKFVQDISQFLADPRYCRVEGKPVIMIYKILDMPRPRASVEKWREHCIRIGIGAIKVYAVHDSAIDIDSEEYEYIDRFVEFPPKKIAALESIDHNKIGPLEADSHYFDYSILVDSVLDGNALADNFRNPMHRGVMMGWDNSPRREKGFSVWVNYSTELFDSWCRWAINYTKNRFSTEEGLFFINAWNEWAEGTYLEPDERFGYANINTVSRAIHALDKAPATLLLKQSEEDSGKRKPPRILLQIHVFYADLLDELITFLSNIPYEFDILATTGEMSSREDNDLVEKKLRCLPMAASVIAKRVPNKGRDIAPLLVESRQYIEGYDLICHIHTKKSTTVSWGHRWRRFMLHNVLGSSDYVASIVELLSPESDIGLVSPPIYPPLKGHISWGGTKKRAQAILNSLLGDSCEAPQLPEKPHFPAGSFFWAKTSCILPLFNQDFGYEMFEDEDSQVEATLAHAIERALPYVVTSQKHSYETSVYVASRDKMQTQPTLSRKKRIGIYAYYSEAPDVKAQDLYLMEEFSSFLDEFVVISNSPLSEPSRKSMESRCTRLLIRENSGYDFGAWKHAIDWLGIDNLLQYDELILVNSSCIGPFVPLNYIFSSMEERECDFWGSTIFPFTKNPERIEATHIGLNGITPRHVQSYFLVFSKIVLHSSIFQDFWNNMEFHSSLLDTTIYCEIKLSSILSKAGFSCDAFCQDHEVLQSHYSSSPSFNAIYNLPYELALLGCPFIKNKLSSMWPGQLAMLKEFLIASNSYPAEIIDSWI